MVDDLRLQLLLLLVRLLELRGTLWPRLVLKRKRQVAEEKLLVLLVPPANAATGLPGATVGSWGQRDEFEPDRKYLVRLAAAAEADDDDEPAAASPEGGPLVWSPFVAVTRPSSLALPSELGEAVQVALEAPERRVCGRAPISLARARVPAGGRACTRSRTLEHVRIALRSRQAIEPRDRATPARGTAGART